MHVEHRVGKCGRLADSWSKRKVNVSRHDVFDVIAN